MTVFPFSRRAGRGFTLIELMIVVAIIGILASVAYPSYTRYVIESKRTEATFAVMKAAQAQEKYFSQNLRYAWNTATLGYATATTENGLYTLAVTGKKSDNSNCAATDTSCPGYVITATAVTGKSQARDADCKVFSYDHLGQKTSKDSSSSASTGCWD